MKYQIPLGASFYHFIFINKLIKSVNRLCYVFLCWHSIHIKFIADTFLCFRQISLSRGKE